jgi:hypothetical protein
LVKSGGGGGGGREVKKFTYIKNGPNIFLITPCGAPLLQILGPLLTGGPGQIAPSTPRTTNLGIILTGLL